jgi:hypothetical protein
MSVDQMFFEEIVMAPFCRRNDIKPEPLLQASSSSATSSVASNGTKTCGL